jgi:hypothetical protein
VSARASDPITDWFGRHPRTPTQGPQPGLLMSAIRVAPVSPPPGSVAPPSPGHACTPWRGASCGDASRSYCSSETKRSAFPGSGSRRRRSWSRSCPTVTLRVCTRGDEVDHVPVYPIRLVTGMKMSASPVPLAARLSRGAVGGAYGATVRDKGAGSEAGWAGRSCSVGWEPVGVRGGGPVGPRRWRARAGCTAVTVRGGRPCSLCDSATGPGPAPPPAVRVGLPEPQVAAAVVVLGGMIARAARSESGSR